MNFFHPIFSQKQIVDATGVEAVQIQNWVKRGLLVGHGNDLSTEGRGNRRSYSGYSLMEIAIAKSIIEAGGMSDLKDTFRAASHFAHFGEDALPGKPARHPGLPFHVANSKTLVLVGRGWSDEIVFTSKDSILHFSSRLLRRGGCLVIDASAAFRQAVTRAGFDPVEIMRFAYGETD